MEQDSPTFPTLRSWRGMSEREQDAYLDRIETRRRWRTIRHRAIVAILCVATIAIGTVLVIAH